MKYAIIFHNELPIYFRTAIKYPRHRGPIAFKMFKDNFHI